MKASILLLALGVAFASGACSQDNVAQRPANKSYRSVGERTVQRSNDRSQFRQEPPRRFGTGFDLNANNPYKFRTVKAAKPYKYSKPARTAKAKPPKASPSRNGGGDNTISTASN